MTRPVVLIVDDEEMNRDLMRRVLTSAYEVREAGDAQAALGLLEQDGAVDLLLCDQVMPGLRGADLAREVKARFPATVTVVLTGYADDPALLEAQAEGIVFDVVAKPWASQHLRDVVARALGR